MSEGVLPGLSDILQVSRDVITCLLATVASWTLSPSLAQLLGRDVPRSQTNANYLQVGMS
jgi:hypothetical protein